MHLSIAKLIYNMISLFAMLCQGGSPYNATVKIHRRFWFPLLRQHGSRANSINNAEVYQWAILDLTWYCIKWHNRITKPSVPALRN